MSTYSSTIVKILSKVEETYNRIGADNLTENRHLEPLLTLLQDFDYTGYFKALKSGEEDITDIYQYPCFAFQNEPFTAKYPYMDIMDKIPKADTMSLPSLDRVYLERCYLFFRTLQKMAVSEDKKVMTFADILTVGVIQRTKDKGRDIVEDIKEYLSTHHTKTDVTAMAAFLYNNKYIRNRPKTFSKFLPQFADVAGVECPGPSTYRASSPQVKSKIKEIENILFYI